MLLPAAVSTCASSSPNILFPAPSTPSIPTRTTCTLGSRMIVSATVHKICWRSGMLTSSGRVSPLVSTDILLRQSGGLLNPLRTGGWGLGARNPLQDAALDRAWECLKMGLCRRVAAQCCGQVGRNLKRLDRIERAPGAILLGSL